MNLNEFARTIALQEGGKINLSIAQVKEVIRLTFCRMYQFCGGEEILETIKRVATTSGQKRETYRRRG